MTGEFINGRLAAEVRWIINAEQAMRHTNESSPTREPRDSSEATLRERVSSFTEFHPRDWQERGVLDFMCKRGQLIVDDADLGRVLQALERLGTRAEIADSLFGGVTLLHVDGDVSTTLDHLDAELGIGVAAPNHVLGITPSADVCPATEPEYPGRTEPWPTVGDTNGGMGIRAAVVDTGFLQGWEVRNDLPWLAGIDEYDVDDPDRLQPSGFIDPYAGHGTFVAGIIRCVAPASDVTVDGVMEVAGVVDEANLVKQIGEALSRSPDLINLSAGCFTRKNLPPKAFTALWERRLRHHKGVALVAAAGNARGREPFWPAAFPWAVSVGALTADGRQRAEFSNYGGWVDVYAPGVDIVNAYCEGEYRLLLDPDVVRTFKGMCKWSGTSFSTPIVTGLIAVRMSRTGENARQAADALLEAARGQFLPGVGPRLLP